MHPALALLEFSSIAAGIAAGDAMIKRGPVAEIVGGTVHPGKYLVMVVGEVGAVEEAVAAGIDRAGPSLIDRVLLSDVHPAVAGAVRGERQAPEGEALGVVETATVAATIAAADAAVKGASVVLTELHLADGLGGKAYALFSGTVSDVEAAVAIAVGLTPPALLSGSVVIPMLHDEMGANLFDSFRFGTRVGWEGFDAAG
jgi:microcompartment protein CcmL/EutN